MVNPSKSKPQPKPVKSESLGTESRHQYFHGAARRTRVRVELTLMPVPGMQWLCTQFPLCIKAEPIGELVGKKAILVA